MCWDPAHCGTPPRSTDGPAPLAADLLSGPDNRWDKAVADNIRLGLTQHGVQGAGPHRLRLWAVDRGVVIQRVVITRD